MSKSPEDYFKEQNFSAQAPTGEGFSKAERAFMDKYLGVDEGEILRKIGVVDPDPVAIPVLEPEQPAAEAEERSLDVTLRNSPELLLVGFFLGGQEFTVPTAAVQEVIRSVPAARLPAAPALVAGVINLRGRITPLVHLRDLLGVSSPRQGEDKFIIICRRQGLQLGMIIERIHTMYHVNQADIDWSIEAHLGINVDFVAGLLKLRESLVGIVSVDKIIASILK